MTTHEITEHLEHLLKYVRYSEDAPALREVIEMLKCSEVPNSSDTISRQAAIDFIDAGHLVNPNEPRWSDNEVVNFLKSRPPAQPEQQWIPCKERLPDKEGNYLITAQPTYNHAKDIRIAHWSGRWVGYVKSEIIAWTPLPEPYRERREG